MRGLRAHRTYANVPATVAPVFALSGTGCAPATLMGPQLRAGAVTSGKLIDGAVTVGRPSHLRPFSPAEGGRPGD